MTFTHRVTAAELDAEALNEMPHSVQVRTSQSASGQGQTRLRHRTSTAVSSA